ncbi:MAG: secretin and TonB N-terminal domain-containing protein, partial [Candidatus Omnitrophica bacterium]|nr:secretin and TonB N-terminal domain-containing protein [Candidatus Omnitrophota bacterium]
MKNYLKVFIFSLVICLFPLKLPAAEKLPFDDSNITISMDFQDANLKDILKLFSIQSGLNFIASEDVQNRRITLFLDKVTIKEAMDKLFKANDLSYELDPDSKIFIVKDWGSPQAQT